MRSPNSCSLCAPKSIYGHDWDLPVAFEDMEWSGTPRGAPLHSLDAE